MAITIFQIIQAVLSFSSVVLALALVYVTWNYAKETEQQTEEMKKQGRLPVTKFKKCRPRGKLNSNLY